MSTEIAEDENNNLALWDQVQTTNPQYTKKGEVSGQSITAINATYSVRKATEAWGPIGVNWGYSIIEDRVDTGGTTFDDEKNIIGNTMTHTIKLELWVRKSTLDPSYPPSGIDGEDSMARVTHYGHTPFIYWSRKSGGYWVTDQEAPKKSLTDALKKCLSMFGFSADIYMGMYDDFSYVEMLKKQDEIEKADDQLVEHIKQKQEYEDWLLKNYKLLETATSIHELEIIFKSAYIKAKRQDDEKGMLKLTRAKDKRIIELGEAKDGKTTVRDNNRDQGTEGTSGNGPGNGDSSSGHNGSYTSDIRGKSTSSQSDLLEPGAGHRGNRQGSKTSANQKKAVRK